MQKAEKQRTDLSGEKFEKPVVIGSGLRYSVVDDESNKTINMSERSQVHDMITRQ